MEQRKSVASPIMRHSTKVLASIATAVALAMAAYVGAYLSLGTTYDHMSTTFRVYPHRWQYHLFHPAARVETWVRGKQFDVGFTERAQ